MCIATCVQLEGYDAESSGSWKVVLDKAIALGVNAVIDRGGLLAGATPREAGNYVLLTEKVEHVTFFENSWRVADLRHDLPKAESSVPEADTMVIYDEARTRGSDMKLKRDAVALLTIDSRTTKDDFMQAVGRLRQFARRQKVVVAYSPTLQLPDGPTEISQVLRFVVNNSVKSIGSGLIPWCDSATRHGATLGGLPNSLEPCPLELNVLYAAPCLPETPHDRLHRRMGELNADSTTTSTTSDFLAEVEHRVSKMAQDMKRNEGGTCLEVELERQQELEQECESMKNSTKYDPGKEGSWDWELAKRSIDESTMISFIKSLQDTPGELMVLSGYCGFTASNDFRLLITCTRNFHHNMFQEDVFLERRISAFLWYPPPCSTILLLTHGENNQHPQGSLLPAYYGTVLLLTHYECSKILPLMLALDTTTTPVPVHLCFLGADANRPHWEAVPPLPEDAPNRDAFKYALVNLLLRDGRCKFHPDKMSKSNDEVNEAEQFTEALRRVIKKSFPSESEYTSRDSAMAVIRCRGRKLEWRSELDKALT